MSEDEEATKSNGEPEEKKTAKRSRSYRPYPYFEFFEAFTLAQRIAAASPSGKIRLTTLFEQLDKSPKSSASQNLIGSANKYGLLKGSYKTEFLELTPEGLQATTAEPSLAIRAQFACAISAVPIFLALYNEYRTRRLGSRDVMRDFVEDGGIDKSLSSECVDLFIANATFLKLLRIIGGGETLIPIEQLIEEETSNGSSTAQSSGPPNGALSSNGASSSGDQVNWSEVCFYVSPIGDEDSEHRRHSDMLLSGLIEPALNGLGLKVVRADQIGVPGVITTQVIDYIVNAGLVIADMSFHNPNVFYEMALRHALRKPIVQICRKADKIPFDVSQLRTIPIETLDPYTLMAQLEVYRSQIATFARNALAATDSDDTLLRSLPRLIG